MTCLYLGIQGILDRDKKDYYGYMNLVITGILINVLFLGTGVYICCKLKGSMLNDRVFAAVAIGWASFSLLVGGLYGVIHHKRIDNKLFIKFSRNELWGAGIGFILTLIVSLVLK